MNKRLDEAEVLIVRRMFRIPWTARRTNKEVLRGAGVKKEWVMLIKRREIGFVGQILRRNGLEKDCLLGMTVRLFEEADQKKLTPAEAA